MKVAAFIGEHVDDLGTSGRRPRPANREVDARHALEDVVLGFAKKAAETWNGDFLALVVGGSGMRESAFHSVACGAETTWLEAEEVASMDPLSRARVVAKAAELIGVDVLLLGVEERRSAWAGLAGALGVLAGFSVCCSICEAVEDESSGYVARHTFAGEHVLLRHTGRLVTTVAPDASGGAGIVTYGDIIAAGERRVGRLNLAALDLPDGMLAERLPGSTLPPMERRRSVVDAENAVDEATRFLEIAGALP